MEKGGNAFPEIVADTIPKALRHGVRKWGDRVYMRRKDLGIWQRYSWNDVYERVRAFSLGLVSMGLQAGETVAIIGENTPELFWADFATLSARGKMVCLYPDMTPDEMLYVLQHSEAVYLIAEDQEQVDKYLEIRNQLPEIRKVIYTTNAIEGYNRQLRKVVKTKGSFPSAESVRKLLYLVNENVTKKWTMPIRDWAKILNQLAIRYDERMPIP